MQRIAIATAWMLLVGCSAPRAQDGAAAQQPPRASGASGQVKGRPDLSPEAYARIPPVPPVGLQVTSEGPKAVLSWKPSRLDTILGYGVYRKVGGGKYEWLGEASQPTFVDAKAPQGPVSYRVTVKTTAGMESPPSEPAVKKPVPKSLEKK